MANEKQEVWIIEARRSAASVAGAAEAPVRGEGGEIWTGTEAEARAEARALNSRNSSPNVQYFARFAFTAEAE